MEGTWAEICWGISVRARERMARKAAFIGLVVVSSMTQVPGDGKAQFLEPRRW